MKYRPGRVHSLSLTALAVVGLALFAVAERSKAPVMQPHFALKMEAATRTRLAMEAVRDARLGTGGPIDVVNDPNETGLIGHEFSLITTSRGSHEQKLKALDPNLAGVFVHLLKRARVEEGDLVAVAVTGAFPMLNAAAIVAIEAVGATPVPITSVGSSMWGANDPELTWLDMEAILEREAIISHTSVAASRGGGDDRGRGLSPEGRALVDAALARNGVASIDEDTLDENIARRMEVYDEAADGREYACYFNVGGGLASIGSEQVGRLLRPGLTRHIEARNFPRRGTLARMGLRGMPVIHVPRADELIERYGLANEPTPLPDTGTGQVFYRDRYNVPLAGVLAALYAFLVFVVVRIDIKHYLFRRQGA
ncbi:MAG: poly-gamma-glutamate system protein [Candidatus Eisenbacteria bacterium]